MATTTPDFERPPVYEALISVEFVALPFDTARLALFAEHLEDWGPTARTVPALAPSVWMSPNPQAMPPIQFFQGPDIAPQRLWFTSPDSQYLLQLQRDRLIVNWRKVTPDVAYPRYDALKAVFDQCWSKFVSFTGNLGQRPTGITVVEFSYFNRVLPAIGGADVYTLVSAPPADLPGRPALTGFQIIRDIDSEEHGSRGQLLLESVPVVELDMRGVQLTLTVRFFPDLQITPDALDRLIASAHGVARQAFGAVTTREAQQGWGSHDGA